MEKQRSDDVDAWEQIADSIPGNGALEMVQADLTKSDSFVFRVKAMNGNGLSEFSGVSESMWTEPGRPVITSQSEGENLVNPGNNLSE